MRWTFDIAVGALYFELSDQPVVSQRVLGDGLIIDVSADDSIVGVEVLGEDARHELLKHIGDLGLADAEVTLLVAVITSQVYGDRERLGITSRPPVESADSYRELQLQS